MTARSVNDAEIVIVWSSSFDRYEVWKSGRPIEYASALALCMDRHPEALLVGNGPDGRPLCWSARPPTREVGV